MTVEPSTVATAVPADVLVSLCGAVRGRVDELVSIDKHALLALISHQFQVLDCVPTRNYDSRHLLGEQDAAVRLEDRPRSAPRLAPNSFAKSSVMSDEQTSKAAYPAAIIPYFWVLRSADPLMDSAKTTKTRATSHQ